MSDEPLLVRLGTHVGLIKAWVEGDWPGGGGTGPGGGQAGRMPVMQAGGRVPDPQSQSSLATPAFTIPWSVLSTAGTVVHLRAVGRTNASTSLSAQVRLAPENPQAFEGWGDGVSGAGMDFGVWYLEFMAAIQPGPDAGTRTWTGRQFLTPGHGASGGIVRIMDPSDRQLTVSDSGDAALGIYVNQATQGDWSEMVYYPGPG